MNPNLHDRIENAFDVTLISVGFSVWMDFVANHIMGFLAFLLLIARLYETKAAKDIVMAFKKWRIAAKNKRTKQKAIDDDPD